jgi:hypothetical protein
MTDQIKQDILQLIRSREVSSRPREVYKEENTKIQNYTSRLDREDVDGVKVSSETCLLAQRQASVPVATSIEVVPLAGTSCQERGVSNHGPREHISRYSGISVQHVRTDKGVKIAITLQKPEWQSEGACQMATAELKRYDRLREIKARADDSEHFAEYLKNAKMDLQEAANRDVCMGRLHQRGRRSQWLYDTLIIAFFSGDRMERVMLYLEGEEHIIEMDQELSESQQKFYLAQGRMGDIVSAQRVPRLDDLPLVKFGNE